METHPSAHDNVVLLLQLAVATGSLKGVSAAVFSTGWVTILFLLLLFPSTIFLTFCCISKFTNTSEIHKHWWYKCWHARSHAGEHYPWMLTSIQSNCSVPYKDICFKFQIKRHGKGWISWYVEKIWTRWSAAPQRIIFLVILYILPCSLFPNPSKQNNDSWTELVSVQKYPAHLS